MKKIKIIVFTIFIVMNCLCACVDKRSDAEKQLDAIHESLKSNGNMSFEERRQLDELHKMLDEAIRSENNK